MFTDAGGTQAQVDVDAGGCGTATNGVVTAQADAAFYALVRGLS